MTKARLAILASLALAAAFAFLGARTLGLGDSVFAGGDPLSFEAELAGANEVPAVETDVVGKAKVEFNDDVTELTFELEVEDGIAVTQSHIHCGDPDEAGPFVVFLAGFHPQTPPAGWNVDGSWIENASATDANIRSADCASFIGTNIVDLEDLLQAMRDGRTYVNVHTVANPGGEVRGQLEAD